MIIFSDARDPIFNSKDPNRAPKTPLKDLALTVLLCWDKLSRLIDC